MPFGEAMVPRQPVGLLQEPLQSLRGASLGKFPPTLIIEQQTVQHPPNQLGLGAPKFPGPRL